MNTKEIWRRILGEPIRSFSGANKTYYIYYDDNGLACTCADFQFRKGSYSIIWTDGTTLDYKNYIRGCKHIAQYLANQGYKVYRKQYGKIDMYQRIEPQR